MRSRLPSFAILVALVTLALGVRAFGISWLVGVGPDPEFSFLPDERFIRLAANFRDNPQGYPLGMAVHLYMLQELLALIQIFHINGTIAIRSISLCYGVLTVLLIYYVAKLVWQYPPPVAVAAAGFLALSPLHVINSHFGTADAAVVFYFWLTVFFAWNYLREQKSIFFVLCAASAGASLAVKFFLPALVPVMFTIFAVERSRLERTVSGVLAVIGGFEVFSFFSYTPWQLRQLARFLIDDAVWAPGGNGPFAQLVYYTWVFVPALGLASTIMLLIAAASSIHNILSHSLIKMNLGIFITSIIRHPKAVIYTALLAHGILIIFSQAPNARYILVFVPLACLIAAKGLWIVYHSIARHTIFGAAVAGIAVFTYQLYAVITTQLLYQRDIRLDVADWLELNVPSRSEISTFSPYSLLAGTKLISTRPSEPYFLTCDLEYARYFLASDASQIDHAYGGQDRLNFFRDIFGAQTKYKIVYSVTRSPFGLEKWLSMLGVLPSLDDWTPNKCIIFGLTGFS